MALFQHHKNQFERNLQFVETFCSPATPYLGWVITVYFYAAVQLVEALLSRKGLHSSNHPERFRHIRTYLHSIYDDYRRLYGASRRARYEVWIPTRIDIERLISNHFEPLRKFLMRKVSKGGSD